MTDNIFNPIQLYISRDDGLCDSAMLPSRDMLINANALKSCCRYSVEDIKSIEACMACS